MADETDDDRNQAPMVWALAVREAEQGPPVAELIVEVGAELHTELVEAAVDSGFTVAAGEPPQTTGTIEVTDDRVARLTLVGGRQRWEPGSRVEATPGWLAAAEARGIAVVVILPPQTWPPGLVELATGARLDAFTRSLERERTAGRVLHGTVLVQGTA
ncbi:hypothetical protein [Streptomyces sp. NRRL S-350]|uniref:hypothetical protein n=1 Tax=Streptomyces sp. NRRL S-350 TaxID=1463902 RepID=UPI0004BE4654|nr:hypothetical protein [Streptomyces sp. NRRL S-350]